MNAVEKPSGFLTVSKYFRVSGGREDDAVFQNRVVCTQTCGNFRTFVPKRKRSPVQSGGGLARRNARIIKFKTDRRYCRHPLFDIATGRVRAL
ncbi:hypothetical protein HMPREF0860_0762 [Treponema socranskii subsp. socranskii VPI DR56BR1116 = ATCC 35536]|uniref:Uncharacterized protein n=1 Tax=Treponema socranskii subsp. socranskii VPI DR56BR1116 = ATCC 35536 TaxID=1125725 RepID=U1FPG2_TRESO|nr:hypothetical protein [Treponema socranskii]ERF61386.1 hypothetical protein HMPREF1325_2194 [Treponema socranskii subsp. socranskii VPI DR56BR1116 = ATCC 35536]ERK04513.1 hypothetical protein HMPREF0860_0762 [Treponema socranskii subsp. socranskii VPI DR56BR1116 = ATCC 35536]